MPHCIMDVSDHWFESWLVIIQHQAITWTNDDMSSINKHVLLTFHVDCKMVVILFQP